MKNFTELEEKKLIAKIWNIHDEIFSLPAKRIVFFHIDNVIGGTTGFAYDCLEKINGKTIKLLCNQKEYDKYIPQFGDQLIVVYCNNDENIQNDFLFEKKSIYNNFHNHYSIIVNVNFLYYREYAQMYRECMESYSYKNHKKFPHITKFKSFECIINDLEEK